MSLRQRLAALEQVIQPGRFLVLELDPARDEREQIDAYHAENGTTARDTLVILCRASAQKSLRTRTACLRSQTTRPRPAAS
jgi:hypothetical protein